MPTLPESLPSLARRGIAQQYRGTDEDAVAMRRAHLRSVMRMTPQLLIGMVGAVGAMLAVFGDARSPALWAWAGTVTGLTLVALALWAWQRARGAHAVRPAVLHGISALAAALALAWGCLTLGFFGVADADQRVVLSVILSGLMGIGSLVLAPLPLANLAWCGVLGAAAAVQSLRQPGALYLLMMALIVVYCVALQVAGLTHWLKSTLLLRARGAALRHERVLALLLEDFEQQAGDALWQVDANARLTHLSPRLAELLGCPEASLRGAPMLPMLQTLAPDSARHLTKVARVGRPFRDLPLTLRVDGAPRHLTMSGKPMFDAGGRLQGWRGVLADVTTRVEHERRIRFQASTDALTGLANRYTLREQLERMVRDGEPGALLCLDLDHFKSLNDSLGHSTSDRVLQAMAQRLLTCVRADDLVARLGGDEFAIVLRGAHALQALQPFADRLVAAIAEPLHLGEQVHRFGTSVGIVALGAAADVDALLAQADMALYASKDAGRGRHVLYDHAIGERSRRRAAMEHALRQAVERGEMRLAWQPKVDLARWQVCGAEALLRWDHPELGRGGPAEFIGVAERAGLIDMLGEWALREACRAACHELRGLSVAVNVSPVQFAGGRLVDQVRAALEASGLEPQRLELEITESVFMADAEAALRQLHALRALGVRIALDDFGTGYSSLAYLRRFPFDTLKIDRSFVVEMAHQADARAIVGMIAQLATTLGMHTVCEGIETEPQLAAARAAGCREMQGYLVARPEPLDALVRRLAQWPGAANDGDVKPPPASRPRTPAAPTAATARAAPARAARGASRARSPATSR